MRWLDENDQIIDFPGRPRLGADFLLSAVTTDGVELPIEISQLEWVTQRGAFGGGFRQYQTDKARITFRLTDNPGLAADQPISITAQTTDMIGLFSRRLGFTSGLAEW